MKKNYLMIAIISLLPMIAIAQVQINQNSLPQAGWTYIVSNDASTTYNVSDSSLTLSQIWDYSHLNDEYQKVPTYDYTSFTPYVNEFSTSTIYTYGPAALYSGLFGAAPVGQQQFNKGYMFWKNDDTGFWSVGFRPEGTNSGATHIQPEELIIPLPGIIGAEYDNFSRWKIEFNGSPGDLDTTYVSQTTKHFVYDAYGKMTTPHGQFDQVLRLHKFSTKIDSVFAFLYGNQVYAMEFSRTVSHNYYYLDAQTEYPILTSYTNENKQVLFTEYRKIRIPSTMNANEIDNQFQFKMYPNPTTNDITLEIGIDETQLILMDLSGKIVYQTSLLAKIQTIPTFFLQPGMYIYRILSADGTVLASEKLIKE